MARTSALLVLALSSIPASLAWNFSVVGDLTECNTITINYTGGSPPRHFQFMQFPPEGSAEASNYSAWNVAFPWIEIPDANLPPNVSLETVETPMQQSFNWSFGPNAVGSRVVIVGSDADGFATGGTSDILTVVASPTGEANCTLPLPAYNTSAALDGFHNLPTMFNACTESSFTYRGDIIGAITVDTIVPGGRSYREYVTNTHANDPTYADQYLPVNWSVVAEVGQEIAIVIGIDVFGIIGINFPSIPQLVSQLVPYLDCPTQSNTKNRTGMIVGIVLGCVVGVALLVIAVLYLLRRRNMKKRRLAQQSIGMAVWKHDTSEKLDATSWGEAKGENEKDEP